MRTLVLACVLAASTARADGIYFTESLGGTDVDDQLAAHLASAFHLRIGVGMRTGAWAVEAHVGAEIVNSIQPVDEDKSLTIYGVDLKLHQPVAAHVEVYLRGGLRYAQIDDGTTGELRDYGGRGIGGGAGIQLKGKVRALGFLAWPLFFTKIGPKVTGALWLDADTSFYRLHPGGRQDATPSVDARLTTISGGFAIGSDF